MHEFDYGSQWSKKYTKKILKILQWTPTLHHNSHPKMLLDQEQDTSLSLEYPGSNGSDREDNMGYCFNAEFAGLERHTQQVLDVLNESDSDVDEVITLDDRGLPAIEDRGLKTGKAMFQELTGLKKPILDKDHILHWHVLLLYVEVMSSDFIEDFCGTNIT
ncbi:hypothetical protein Tco_1196803, partial [Tanacetum coccineum]